MQQGKRDRDEQRRTETKRQREETYKRWQGDLQRVSKIHSSVFSWGLRHHSGVYPITCVVSQQKQTFTTNKSCLAHGA